MVDSRGELHGRREHVRFTGASLVKAMLLVAYLRKEPHPASLDAAATLMIEESDNAAAYAVQGAVGMSGIKKVAKLAGMQDFKAGGSWIDCQVSAADQARFFYDYLSYVPASRRSFARKLLNGITPMQRWGIPAAAGPDGWKTYFKSGWLELDNVLMVQAAWVGEEGRQVVGRGDDRREPHQVVRLGHAEGVRRAAARARAHPGVPGARARVARRRAVRRRSARRHAARAALRRPAARPHSG